MCEVPLLNGFACKEVSKFTPISFYKIHNIFFGPSSSLILVLSVILNKTNGGCFLGEAAYLGM